MVIPDEEEAIVSTVKELSQMVGRSGYVFTTGGIGPTHDDITYESVVCNRLSAFVKKMVVIVTFSCFFCGRRRHLVVVLSSMKRH